MNGRASESITNDLGMLSKLSIRTVRVVPRLFVYASSLHRIDDMVRVVGSGRAGE